MNRRAWRTGCSLARSRAHARCGKRCSALRGYASDGPTTAVAAPRTQGRFAPCAPPCVTATRITHARLRALPRLRAVMRAAWLRRRRWGIAPAPARAARARCALLTGEHDALLAAADDAGRRRAEARAAGAGGLRGGGRRL